MRKILLLGYSMKKKYLRKLSIVIIPCVLLMMKPNSSIGKELIFANTHYPPWVVVQKNKMSGVDVEIVKELAKRLNLKLTLSDCPWKRCLRMLEKGEIDIMSGLFKRTDREVYAHFIEPPYRDKNITAFYTVKSKKHIIQKYDDLLNFTVGTTRGVAHFPRFDEDAKIQKILVTDMDQLFEMLSRNHLDVIIGDEPTYDYFRITKGYSKTTEKTDYKFVNKAEGTYLTLSKKSSFNRQISKFNSTMESMVGDGIIASIYDNFMGPNQNNIVP